MEDEVDDYYEVYRMCPPKTSVKFFFTDPMHERVLLSKDHKIVESDTKINFEIEYADGTIIRYSPISSLNVI